MARGGFVYGRPSPAAMERPKDFVRLAERLRRHALSVGRAHQHRHRLLGLVQLSLQGTGMHAPRDSDMQEAELGEALQGTDIEG